MTETNRITADLLVEIPARFPGVRVWRNNRIKALATGRAGKKRMVEAGVKGQADISGIVPGGRRLEVEVKVGRDTLSEDQVNFGQMIEGLGGIYLIARDVPSGLNALETALKAVPKC